MTETPIVLLGPKGTTFTYRAYGLIASVFGAPPLNGNVIEAKRNRDVLEALIHNPNSFGSIAAETKVGGRINDSLEAFIRLGRHHKGECKPRIIGAAKVPLSFAAMTNGIGIDEVEGVVAHPQALEACRYKIDQYGWLPEDSTSNGQAAQDVATNPRYAKFVALGPVEAAEKYGLTVVDDDFQRGVTTFFLLTSGNAEVRTGPYNRALVVFRTRGGPGALVDALKPFKRQKINMIHIHSVHTGNGIYEFVAEIEGTGSQLDRMNASLDGLRLATESCSAFGPFEVIEL